MIDHVSHVCLPAVMTPAQGGRLRMPIVYGSSNVCYGTWNTAAHRFYETALACMIEITCQVSGGSCHRNVQRAVQRSRRGRRLPIAHCTPKLAAYSSECFQPLCVLATFAPVIRTCLATPDTSLGDSVGMSMVSTWPTWCHGHCSVRASCIEMTSIRSSCPGAGS